MLLRSGFFISTLIFINSSFQIKKGWSEAKLSFAHASEKNPSLPYPENTNPLDTLTGSLGLLCFILLYLFSVFMSIDYMMPFCFGIISLMEI